MAAKQGKTTMQKQSTIAQAARKYFQGGEPVHSRQSLARRVEALTPLFLVVGLWLAAILTKGGR